MWEFNKGEWAEAYVFLYLLVNGKLYGAKENLQQNSNSFINICNILRYENNHIYKYERMPDNNIVQFYDNDTFVFNIEISPLNDNLVYLFNSINQARNTKMKFSIPPIEEYLRSLKFSQPKIAQLPVEISNQYGTKTDIILTAEDSIDHARTTVGFSIKSHLGNRPTLFNSAPASNLKFEIEGCTDEIMNKLNTDLIDKPTKMIGYIKKHPDLSLYYVGTSAEFANNLDLIDPRMETILSELMLIQIRYHDGTKSNKISKLVEVLEKIDPLKANSPEIFYKTKIKDLLYASYSGLTATLAWDGCRRLSGGYINVNSNGKMVYFRSVPMIILLHFCSIRHVLTDLTEE